MARWNMDIVESWTWDLLRWDMGKLRQLLQSSVPFCGACAVSTTEEIKKEKIQAKRIGEIGHK